MAHATYEETLRGLAEADPRVIVMTAENRAAIRGLPPILGNRFIDVGICEQTMVGAAAGLALTGRVPICHALATFLTLRAFEFIRTDVGIGKLPVKLVGGVPGFLSEANGPTHQAIEDIALMRGIPGMQIVCPADEEELVAALPAIMKSPSPCYVRYYAGKAVAKHTEAFVLGRAERLSEGSDIGLLSFGMLVGQCHAAKEILTERGHSVELVNLRTLAPLDEDAIVEAAAKTKLLVTVEDHFLVGGLYSAIAEILVRRRISTRVLPIALEGRWFTPGLLAEVLEKEGFTGAHIAARIERELAIT
jgi:transketolase